MFWKWYNEAENDISNDINVQNSTTLQLKDLVNDKDIKFLLYFIFYYVLQINGIISHTKTNLKIL